MTIAKISQETGAGLGLLQQPVSGADLAFGPLLEISGGTLFNAGALKGRGVRNLMVQGDSLQPGGASYDVQVASIAGQPAVAVQDIVGYRLVSQQAINPSEWTIFFVLDFSSVGVSAGRDLLRSETSFSTGYTPRIVLSNTDQLYIAQNSSSTVRLNAGTQAAETPALFAITLSEEQGLAIWKNGARVAHAPDDTAPFDDGYQAGGWVWGRQNQGTGYLRLGWCGHVNVDLSRWRYSGDGQAGHMARITTYLKGLYGIA